MCLALGLGNLQTAFSDVWSWSPPVTKWFWLKSLKVQGLCVGCFDLAAQACSAVAAGTSGAGPRSPHRRFLLWVPCHAQSQTSQSQVRWMCSLSDIYIYIYDIHISIIVSTFIILSCKKHQNHQPTSTYPPDHAFANIDCEWCLRNP